MYSILRMSENFSLEILIKKFLCCTTITDINFEKYLYNITWKDQEYLLNKTINNDLIKQYPIKISYQKLFLKNIIQVLEKNNIEINDDVYETYCNIINTEDLEKYYYKHYLVNSDIITLKENKNIVSEGTTGLVSWQASFVLSEWCLVNKPKLQNQSILELGSGIGLLGITVHKFCHPKHLTLSDCHPQVLQVLTDNLRLNCVKSDSDNSCAGFDSSRTSDSDSVKLSSDLEVLNLNWEFVSDGILPDLILAADVVYDSTVFEPLCKTFRYFMDKNSKIEVILSCTERNSNTLQEFLLVLKEHELKVDHLIVPQQNQFFWSTSVPIKLFLITKEDINTER